MGYALRNKATDTIEGWSQWDVPQHDPATHEVIEADSWDEAKSEGELAAEAFAAALKACHERRGVIALTVHSAPKFVPLTGLLGPTTALIDTNAAGEFVGMQAPENGCVVGLSMMEASAAGYVDPELIHAGTGYWIKIQAQRDDIPAIELREFTGFRLAGGTLVKTRFRVPNQEVEAKLLKPYRDEAVVRQTNYEADRRLVETATTIEELNALFNE